MDLVAGFSIATWFAGQAPTTLAGKVTSQLVDSRLPLTKTVVVVVVGASAVVVDVHTGYDMELDAPVLWTFK